MSAETRRAFIGHIGFTAIWWSNSLVARAAGKVQRVGFLAAMATPAVIAAREGLSRELAQRGYMPDRDLIVELHTADGKVERLPGIARDLAASGVDVIVTSSYPAARAAKEATTAIPIIAASAGDPVETGLAASLRRPDGNLTESPTWLPSSPSNAWTCLRRWCRG